MKTEEHLELILTFCRSRLALAEKRTLGAWTNQPISMTGYTLLRAGDPWGKRAAGSRWKPLKGYTGLQNQQQYT